MMPSGSVALMRLDVPMLSFREMCQAVRAKSLLTLQEEESYLQLNVLSPHRAYASIH
jgi:hypothetical protein